MSANWFSSLSVQDLWTLLFVLYVAASVVVGALCGYVADAKGRSGWSWFFLGFFCGIFALIAIAGTPPLVEEPYKPEGWQGIEDRLKAQRDDPENWTGRGGTQ
jgi:MFS family permease